MLKTQLHHPETFVFFTFPTGQTETIPPRGGGFLDAKFSFSFEMRLLWHEYDFVSTQKFVSPNYDTNTTSAQRAKFVSQSYDTNNTFDQCAKFVSPSCDTNTTSAQRAKFVSSSYDTNPISCTTSKIRVTKLWHEYYLWATGKIRVIKLWHEYMFWNLTACKIRCNQKYIVWNC